ncbi:MAG: hypothetical protein Q7R83_03265 [bacterium]|nr:hypothetical protein [bacterium]
MKQRNVLKYFLVFVLFALTSLLYVLFRKTALEKEFLAIASKVPSLRTYGSGAVQSIRVIASTWGPWFGPALGIVAWLLSLVVYGILKITRLARFWFVSLIGVLLVYTGALLLAIELLYFEARYSAVAIAAVVYVGRPLFFASIVALAFAVILYILPFLLRKRHLRVLPSVPVVEPPLAETAPPVPPMAAQLFLLASAALLLPGCNLVGDTEGLACLIAPDSSHCYQDMAVSSGDSSICERVHQPERFKASGSNPPQDKCYLMVAQNTNNLDACKKIKGGFMSYTQEECILTVSLEYENPAGCQQLSGAAKTRCVGELGPKMTPDKVLEIDNQIDILNAELKNGSDTDLEKQLKGLQDRRNGILAVMTKENKVQYEIQSDPLNKEIIGDWAVGTFDSATKNQLIDLNQRLKGQGMGMTANQYTAVRDYLSFINDPENDIEKMDDAAIVKNRFGENVQNTVDKFKIWKTKDTQDEKALDEQLRFYERMLERQKGIEAKLSVHQQGISDFVENIKEKAQDKGVDVAKDKLIEHLFGEVTGSTVGMTTKVLEEALNEVKAAAKSAEFRGLVKAYDNGMAEEVGRFGGSVEKAHAEVVKKLSADPYAYANGNSFAKYGNLIENKECDGSNPHCLNKDVFWKAMKKSYTYQH